MVEICWWRWNKPKTVSGFVSVLFQFLVDRTNGHAYATMLRPSVVCSRRLWRTIVAINGILEQILTADRKSYL